MGLRPQTLYGIADSPIGLAAWILDHDARSLELISRSFDGVPEGLTRDDVLDNITLFWLTNTAISAARLYWEFPGLPFFDVKNVSIPVAVSVFLTRSYQLRAVGQSGPIPNLSITTSSTKAATLRPGNSLNSFQKRFAPASDHCAPDRLSRFGPQPPFSVTDLFLSYARCKHVSGQVIKMSRGGSTNSDPRLSGRDFSKIVGCSWHRHDFYAFC